MTILNKNYYLSMFFLFSATVVHPLAANGQNKICQSLVETTEVITKQMLSDCEQEASQGDMHAQYNLAVIYHYERGMGTIHDAVNWYEKAGEQGHVEAQNTLGVLYTKGYGGVVKSNRIKRDYEKGIYWLEKAAKQGMLLAQINLGSIYSVGFNEELEDAQKAIYWHEKAAAQGDVDSKFILGNIYRYGEGVEKDLNKALHWYEKAAQEGDDNAKEQIKYIKSICETVAEACAES